MKSETEYQIEGRRMLDSKWNKWETLAKKPTKRHMAKLRRQYYLAEFRLVRVTTTREIVKEGE